MEYENLEYKEIATRKICLYVGKNNKFFNDKGKKITKTIAKSLLTKGKVNVKGFKKKDGKGTYDATVIMSINGDYVNFKLEFNNK